MKISRLIKPFLAAALIIISTPFFFPQAASIDAQEAGTLTIIPPRFELFTNPGDSLSESIRIRNEANVPQAFTVYIEDFTAAGEEGQVFLEEEENDASYSLASWIEPEARDLVLQPGEETTFNFTINTPRDAEPGGHYASILFQTQTEEVPGAAAVAQRIGALILLRVSGNVTEDAQIESFSAPTYQKTGPVPITLRIKNEGNTHIAPSGTIIITNLFGKKVDEIPLNGANVLPGATRKMDTEWQKDRVLGYFTATLVATYGQQQLPLTAATSFTVLSPTVAILAAVGAIAAIIFILSLVSGRKRIGKALKVIFTGK